jgi:hypothetical protein
VGDGNGVDVLAAQVAHAPIVDEILTAAHLAVEVDAVVSAAAAPDRPTVAFQVEHVAPVERQQAAGGPLADRSPAGLSGGGFAPMIG